MILTQRHKSRTKRGFSLTDLLFASTLFTVAIMAVAWCHLFGLTLHSRIGTQLNAAAHERKLWGYLSADIETARKIRIGNMNGTSFVELGINTNQVGTALQLFPELNNTANSITYFLDAKDRSLKRITSSATEPLVLSTYIVNRTPFQFEDSKGTVLTNGAAVIVVSATFSYSQFQDNGGLIGAKNYYQSFVHSRRFAHRKGT